jgi:hypothetical protein
MVIPPFMIYDEAASELLFDTRTTPRANYQIIFSFNGPYADRPVIRELNIDINDDFEATLSNKTTIEDITDS